jgi:predicted nucleic acid-binding protein
LAERVGLKAVGTLGILLLAKQRGLIPIVQPLLDKAVDQGFRLGRALYHEVLRLAGEA